MSRIEKSIVGNKRIPQCLLVSQVGQRLREARELAGLSQIAAAKRLGYVNSSRLAKIEGAIDVGSLHPRIIHDAALIYGVSSDYIYGLSDDWERNADMAQGHDVARSVIDGWEAARARDVNILRRVNNKITVLARAVQESETAVHELRGAYEMYERLNPESMNPDEVAGAARLLRAIDAMENAIKVGKEQMRRFKVNAGLEETATSPQSLMSF
jgi:transcriptional regulator with XRE-family HTH domain